MNADGCMLDVLQQLLLPLSRQAAFCVVMRALNLAKNFVSLSGSVKVEQSGESLVILGIKF